MSLHVPVPGADRAGTPHRRRGAVVLLGLVTAALALVVVAPAMLSSADILRWAQSPDGLHLPAALAWFAFVALDAAAVVCVGMAVYAAWRGEGGGAFQLLTWVFAGASAWFNYRFGLTTPAPDDQYFFPVMSLVGPLLLEVTLTRLRRWVRTAEGLQRPGRPSFGLLRWLVSPRETGTAWAVAVREGVSRPDDALNLVRDRAQLQAMTKQDAVRFAFQAVRSCDPNAARIWLQARGVPVTWSDVAAADGAGSPVVRVRVVRAGVRIPLENDATALRALTMPEVPRARRSSPTATARAADERPRVQVAVQDMTPGTGQRRRTLRHGLVGAGSTVGPADAEGHAS